MDDDHLEPRARLVKLIAGLIAGESEDAGKTGVTEPEAARTMAKKIVDGLSQAGADQGNASVWVISPASNGVASLKADSPRGAQVLELLRFL
jgi:hypothetical protein